MAAHETPPGVPPEPARTEPVSSDQQPPIPPLAGLDLEGLRDLLVGLGEPAYRAKQVFQVVQNHGVLDPHRMTALPIALRERLAAATSPALSPIEIQTSSDGTTKFLFALADGKRVETVLIPEGDRNTVCVSTQVGCPIRCVFCASGVEGLIRNLSTAEIAEQMLHVRAHLGERPTHIVAMGMGEPLLNLPALTGAIRLWVEHDGLGFSPRRITVSTAGTPSKVDQLIELQLGVNLAISLHAPNDETRARLVPGSPAGRTAGLIEAGARFARETGRDATVEYVLIAGENDHPEHAEDLARLVAGRHIHVNLIPLNPVSHQPELRAPSSLAAQGFARRLHERGATVTLRRQRGDDIAAACGQLALERSVGEA